jgi:hypothetical protein
VGKISEQGRTFIRLYINKVLALGVVVSGGQADSESGGQRTGASKPSRFDIVVMLKTV